MPADSPVIVVVLVLPLFVPPVYVTVHVPEGNPLNATLPVADAQVVCVIVPIVGAVGVVGCVLTTTLKIELVQPPAVVDVKLYVPAATPVNLPEVLV